MALPFRALLGAKSSVRICRENLPVRAIGRIAGILLIERLADSPPQRFLAVKFGFVFISGIHSLVLTYRTIKSQTLASEVRGSRDRRPISPARHPVSKGPRKAPAPNQRPNLPARTQRPARFGPHPKPVRLRGHRRLESPA